MLENSHRDLTATVQASFLPTLSEIVSVASAVTGVSAKDIYSDRRNKYIVDARHIAILVAYNETNKTYAAIGRHFKRDHTTIMYSVLKAYEKKRVDELFKRHYSAAIAELRGVERV